MDIRKLLNTQNQDLFDAIVNSGLKLKQKRSEDSCWGAHIEDTNTHFVISYAPSKWANASITHELLHIHLQRISGFKRVRSGKSGQFNFDFFVTICGELDNHFQHIKFYQDFLRRGFLPQEFYCAADLLGENKLRAILSQSGRSLYSISFNFVTLISPGGILSNEKRDELKDLFFAYDGNKYETELREVEQIFSDWRGAATLNHEPYYDRFFKIFNLGQVWLSYDKNPQTDNGFFAG